MQLRPYQADLVTRIRDAYRAGKQAPLLVLPTGGGKTCLFSFIAHGAAERGTRVLILAHRHELIDQIRTALRDFQVEPDVIAAEYPRHASHIAVASVQTLIRRLGAEKPFDMIICDEAHHCATTEKAHQGANSWARIFHHWPKAKRLGVTATPIRLDGRGLGEFFDDILIGPSVAELTEQGFLAPARIFAPPSSVDTSKLHQRGGDYIASEVESQLIERRVLGDALSHYRKHADGKRALVFTISVDYARQVAEQFAAAGYRAYHLHGGTHPGVRRQAVADFQSGALQILASCDLFSEGFDCPGAEAGIFLRPTASLALYRQQCGRILRPFNGKQSALLLDHVGNTARHGFPDDEFPWALTYDQDVKKKAANPFKVCPACFTALRPWVMACECGHEFQGKPREIEQHDGELLELTSEHRKPRAEQALATTFEQLQEFGRQRGYAPGWAMHVWRARQAKLRA